jgi:hypothetical protein
LLGLAVHFVRLYMRSDHVKHAPLQRTPRSYSSVFNSSVPQRPAEKYATRSYGGRPLGPSSYNPTPPAWLNEPLRELSSFASKTPLRKFQEPITAQLDFLSHAGQLEVQYGAAPGAHGLRWPSPPEEREVVRDPGLDNFSDTLVGSLGNEVALSSRSYASSFQSTSKRGFNADSGAETPAELGPGVYELQLASIRVHDPKRASYTFKSTTTSSSFGTPSVGQPPDTIQSIQSAILRKHWTARGVAFSTRERFPRVRPRWKD